MALATTTDAGEITYRLHHDPPSVTALKWQRGDPEEPTPWYCDVVSTSRDQRIVIPGMLPGIDSNLYRFLEQIPELLTDTGHTAMVQVYDHQVSDAMDFVRNRLYTDGSHSAIELKEDCDMEGVAPVDGARVPFFVPFALAEEQNFLLISTLYQTRKKTGKASEVSRAVIEFDQSDDPQKICTLSTGAMKGVLMDCAIGAKARHQLARDAYELITSNDVETDALRRVLVRMQECPDLIQEILQKKMERRRAA